MVRGDITSQFKIVGKMILFFLISWIMINNSYAQRTRISDGIYVFSYGNIYIIEDDINQISVSMIIQQERINDRTNETIYKVVCEKWSRRVTSIALEEAIEEVVKYAVPTSESSLISNAATALAKWIYKDVWIYWKNIDKKQVYSYPNKFTKNKGILEIQLA